MLTKLDIGRGQQHGGWPVLTELDTGMGQQIHIMFSFTYYCAIILLDFSKMTHSNLGFNWRMN